MELEEFKSNCNNKRCLKHQRYDSKTCVRESKQLNCFKSWSRQEIKKQNSFENSSEIWEKEKEFLDSVWFRDTGEIKGESAARDNWIKFCKIWKILNEKEKMIVLKDEELYTAKDLDVAHIKPKSTAINEKHDINNVVLVSRLFHRRLTDLLHPINKTRISNEEARLWLESARDGKRKID